MNSVGFETGDQENGAKQADIDSMSFEQALGELETIIRQLESGSAPLDATVELFERGNLLKKRCEVALKAAQKRIDEISTENSRN